MNEYSCYISEITDLKEDIYKSLQFVGWKDHVKKDSTLFLKPNFTYPYYKEGITTSPQFIKSILEILKDRADNVIIGESNGGNHSFTADEAFKGHGMHEICKETGVELVNLSKMPCRTVEEQIQDKKVKVLLPDLLLDDVDCFISVPVLKVHVMTYLTLSIKNLWGCYPDTMRCLHHKNLSQKLALITKKLNPKLIVLDGTYALDGHGPMYGEPKELDLLLSSNNPVTLDSLCANIMGISVEKAEHIMMCEKEGLGSTDLKKVKFNQDPEKFKMQFSINKTLVDTLSKLFFKSENFSKFVMDSPATPLIYKVGKYLRNTDEQDVVDEIKKYYKD